MSRRRLKHYFKYWLPGFLALFFLAALLGGAIYVLVAIRQLPSLNEFNSRQINQSTKIFDRTGKVLLYEIHGEEKRTVIPFEEIPDVYKKAVLTAEDSNFYGREAAFDWRGILRAVFTNLKGGQVVGGSTITQQLARNLFLTPKKTIDRKLKELILAIELESKYSKDEILSLYLNQIPYGSNAYGIETASQIYFSKKAKDLSLAEAAALAGIIKAPSYYSPWGNYKKEFLERKDYIIDRMAALGFIDEDQKKAAKKEVLVFAPQSLGSIQAPHFAIMVKEYLINKYGEDLVEKGGLKVITTLDWDFQELAEEAVAEGSANNEELYGAKNASLVAADPKTGQILALVGSRNYFDTENDGNFNVASQGLRQPGSALKPFIYLTAFQKGYSPKTILFDVQTEFDTRNDPATSYKPVNFDGRTRGPVSMENALAQSLNIPAVKTLYLAGFDDVLANLHAFGIASLKERWRYGLSLTLGGGEVRLIDLVSAYSTLSQDGVFHQQSIVLKVEDSSGKIIEEYEDETKRVADPQPPRLVHQILSNPELRRPIFGSTVSLTIFPDHEVALKTGTSEDHRDAWTVGYTKSLVVGVWAGNNNNEPMIRQGSSILAAIPMWSSFMNGVIKKYPSESFDPPEPPTIANKPMLNGEYVWPAQVAGSAYPQIHSLLYYVDKNNPLGEFPNRPDSDPQFNNWEAAVLAWISQNVPNIQNYNRPLPGQASFADPTPSSLANDISINNILPGNGQFVSLPISIRADLASASGLSQVKVLLNKKTVSEFGLFGQTYHYEYFLPSVINLFSQNVLEIKVSNLKGQEKTSSVIFFLNN